MGMLNDRLGELAKKPDCPFLQGQAGYGQYIYSKTKDAFEMNALPKELACSPLVTAMVGFAGEYLPFFTHGFGWLVPAVAGLVIGLVLAKVNGDI